MRYFIIATLLVAGTAFPFTSCSNSSQDEGSSLTSGDISVVNIRLEPEFYDSIAAKLPLPRMTVLKEEGDMMFTFPDRIFDSHGLYFVLDRSGSRTVMSFTHNGMPFARYGRMGQGPGEYVSPWDVDVSDSIVHILDTNSKKILRYAIDGTFLSEQSLPFFADAIKLTEKGNVMLNLTPMGQPDPQVCVTDNSMENLSYRLRYPKRYLGGVITADVFRNAGNDVLYYRSPMDTIYTFRPDGTLKSAMVLDFNGKGITEEARADFVAARRAHQIDDAMILANSPIELGCGLWVGLVSIGNEQYTILFDPMANKCGGRKFSSQSSVYDIIEPYGTDESGCLMSLIDGELAAHCRDYDMLDDSIKAALSSGSRILLLHNTDTLSMPIFPRKLVDNITKQD